jgi:hypothetical protein
VSLIVKKSCQLVEKLKNAHYMALPLSPTRGSRVFSSALRAQRAPALLKLKAILQFFQQLIHLLRRFLRRPFLAVTQLNLDPERQG